MNILDLYNEYPEKEESKFKFELQKNHRGFISGDCISIEYYLKKYTWSFLCQQGKYRTSMLSRSIIGLSKLAFQYWFTAMHSTKRRNFLFEIVQKYNIINNQIRGSPKSNLSVIFHCKKNKCLKSKK